MIRLVTIVFLSIFYIASARDFVVLNPTIEEPEISIEQSNLDYTVATISFPGFYVQDTLREGIVYQLISMPKTGITIKVGYPQLPQTVRLNGIDFRGEYRVSLISADYVEFENMNVFPAQPQPLRIGEKFPWTINELLYQSDSWYPEKMVSQETPAILRNYRTLPVVIQPVQFNPVKRKIRVAKSISFRVEKIASTGVNEQQYFEAAESPVFQPLYQNFIINYSYIRKSQTPGVRGLPDMLIITHDIYYNEVVPFAEWKNQKGVYTKVVKTSEIGSNPTASQIKNYIQNYFNNATDKPDYLLIVGDVTGANAVPWFSVSGSMSDMPYYFLEGNDILADISGGRISVQTTAEANTVFTKLIRYEKQPYMTDPNWFHSAFVINSNDFQDPVSGQWAENQFTNYGYNPVHHIGDNFGNATIANVYAAVDSGVSYIYYIGHGGPKYWVTTGFSTTHIPALTNGEMQPVISSVACNNADLDKPYDVFAEVWLKNDVNNGAVGMMGFTESCAVYETDTLARGMVRAILSDTITAFGNVIDYGRLHMFQSYGNGSSAPMHQSILIGEPELEVWTKTPEAITVNAPQAGFFNIPFTVQVSNIQGPLPGALVCYWDTLGNYARGFTDANGEITLDHGAQQPVTGLITVSGHNLLPFQNTIDILPPQGPYVLAQHIFPNDSSGNNNGIVEAGEHLFFRLELANIGVDPADSVSAHLSSADSNITFLNSDFSFGNLAAGASVNGGNFEAQISANCPHLHLIPLQVAITTSDSNHWEQQLFLKVREGAHIQLAQQSLLFDDTYLHFTSQLDLPVSNTGPDTLWVSGIQWQTAQFSAQPQQFFVAPNQQQIIQVNFTPDTTLTYHDTLTIINSDPIQFQTTFVVSGTGIFVPQIATQPDSIPFYAQPTDSLTEQLLIENQGLGSLVFQAQVSGYNPGGENLRGSGGADAFGHIWIDSDEPGGPAFDWIDISTSGTAVALTGNNAISDPVSIGFDFSFYGNNYNKLRICTNGWMSFTTFSVAYNNVALPSNLAPRCLIAPLWDDLNVTDSSKVFSETRGNKFIVQFQDVYRITGEGPYTFQTILYDNGNILLQYLTLDSLVDDYTVGIQNHDATDGLTVAFNESYLHQNLAVLISRHSWLSVFPLSGTIGAQSSQALTLTAKTHNFPFGSFFASIQIESNDPANPVIYVPVHLMVGVTGLDAGETVVPKTVQLSRNYPNPFNPTTLIRYAIPARQKVELSVYNLLGQKVRTLVNGIVNRGLHEVTWDGRNQSGNTVGSGIYIYRLQTDKRTITNKMILIR